jgi:hypothetical protein
MPSHALARTVSFIVWAKAKHSIEGPPKTLIWKENLP